VKPHVVTPIHGGIKGRAASGRNVAPGFVRPLDCFRLRRRIVESTLMAGSADPGRDRQAYATLAKLACWPKASA